MDKAQAIAKLTKALRGLPVSFEDNRYTKGKVSKVRGREMYYIILRPTTSKGMDLFDRMSPKLTAKLEMVFSKVEHNGGCTGCMATYRVG